VHAHEAEREQAVRAADGTLALGRVRVDHEGGGEPLDVIEVGVEQAAVDAAEGLEEDGVARHLLESRQHGPSQDQPVVAVGVRAVRAVEGHEQACRGRNPCEIPYAAHKKQPCCVRSYYRRSTH
jgi:hypothetical protein